LENLLKNKHDTEKSAPGNVQILRAKIIFLLWLFLSRMERKAMHGIQYHADAMSPEKIQREK